MSSLQPLLLIILLAISACQTQPAGYSIAVNLEEAGSADSVYLYRYGGTALTRLEAAPLKRGEARFTGTGLLDQGMYAIGVNPESSISFLMSEGASQHFSMSADPGELPVSYHFSGSPENSAFAGYQQFMDSSFRIQTALNQRLQRNSNREDSTRLLWAAVRELETAREKRLAAVNRDFPGSMIALYAQAIREVPVPEPPIPLSAGNRDHLMQEHVFRHMTRHFFDGFPFSDPRITATPLLEKKLSFYFRQLVHPHPDSVVTYAASILEKEDIHNLVYSQAAKTLYDLFRSSPLPEHQEVCSALGERFILPFRSRFTDTLFVERVEERTLKSRLNPPGSTATDLLLQTPEGKQIVLSGVEASLIILYFFDPGCDACQSITEELSGIYNTNKSKGIEVFAVYLGKERKAWTDYIASKKLHWINVYDPDGTEKVEEKYDIYAMPMIYLLDRDKKVIARDVPVEQINNFLHESR